MLRDQPPPAARISRIARGTVGLALLLALGGPAGCRQEEVEEARPAPPAAQAPPRELTPDERLAEAVREALLQAPALASENIDISVVQGQVFLAGEVSAPHLRDEAVAVAGSVPGVQGVQSKINVRTR